jgi:AcrR family transcriptional regulator
MLSDHSVSGNHVTTPTKRDLRAQERRSQLIDTALALFAEKGVERTTIKDIAERAGVAQGLVYHYFDSKDALFYAIIERHNPLPIISAALVDVADRPLRDVLLRLAETAYNLMREKRAIIIVVAREALTRPDLQQRIFALQSMGIALFADFMRGRIAAGEARPHAPEVSGRMLISSALALHLTNAPASLLPEVIDTLLHGIAPD